MVQERQDLTQKEAFQQRERQRQREIFKTGWEVTVGFPWPAKNTIYVTHVNLVQLWDTEALQDWEGPGSLQSLIALHIFNIHTHIITHSYTTPTSFRQRTLVVTAHLKRRQAGRDSYPGGTNECGRGRSAPRVRRLGLALELRAR